MALCKWPAKWRKYPKLGPNVAKAPAATRKATQTRQQKLLCLKYCKVGVKPTTGCSKVTYMESIHRSCQLQNLQQLNWKNMAKIVKKYEKLWQLWSFFALVYLLRSLKVEKAKHKEIVFDADENFIRSLLTRIKSWSPTLNLAEYALRNTTVYQIRKYMYNRYLILDRCFTYFKWSK